MYIMKYTMYAAWHIVKDIGNLYILDALINPLNGRAVKCYFAIQV